MTTKKVYEVLASLPVYGPMYVSVTESGEPFYSEGFPVRFYKNDGTGWVANFQPGWTDFAEIIELEKIQNLLVIARGTCYIMNPNDTKPIDVFGAGYCDIFKASKNRYVFQDQIDLTIFEEDGTHWNTEPISCDGLKEIKVENNLVSGLAFYPMNDADEWIEFQYDLDTKTLTGGSFIHFENKKPWWKIW